MSEYWKSTPKYWCKHCKTFVRDTKLEKANHEATPKHQGNLKRFLRDLHRGHEKEEKDKERAKAEVARLNGISSGGGGSSVAGPSSSSSSAYGQGPKPKPQATAAQRKAQLAQLEEMGVTIPDEFRPDMAMAGEWQVTETRIIQGDGETKPDAVALGVRKRIVEDEEEEKEAKKLRWGSKFKTHPVEEDNTDLDALLNNVIRKNEAPEIKTESGNEGNPEIKQEVKTEIDESGDVKLEPTETGPRISDAIPSSDIPVKAEGDEPAAGVVFKKRKAKNIRQK